MTLRCFTFAIVAAVISAIQASAQDTCATVLGNVYDKTTYSGYHIGSRSFESFFCERTFSSEAQARNAAAQVGIPIDGLPLQLGGHYRSNDWSAYSHELCRMVRSNETVNEGVYAQIQQVDQAVIAAWAQCVTNTRPGLYFWAEVNDDARTVALLARWQPTGIEDSAIAVAKRRVLVLPAGRLDCPDRFPPRIGIGAETVLCTRLASQGGAVSASLKTRTKGSPKVSVPPVPQPSIQDPPCINPVRLSRNAPVTASQKPESAGAVTDGNADPGNWNSGAFAPQWVQIAFQQPIRVTHIELNPEQHVADRTVHQIFLFQRQPDGTTTQLVLATHDANTVRGGVFTVVAMPQVPHVTAVRVETDVSPSHVSWREIEVYGCRE